MKRVDRRHFMMLASVGATGAVLSACGNELDVEVNPTQIPDVAGAPPTLAPPAASPAAGASGAEQPTEAASGGEQAPADGAASGAGQPVVLEAMDPYEWSTNAFEVAPGQVIQITNVGLGQHDFSVDEWGVQQDLPVGEPVEVTVPDDAAPGDTFVYYCSVPGHRENGMEGELTIVEAAAAAAAPEEQPAAGGETPPENAAAGGAGQPVVLEAMDPYEWSTNTLEVAPGQVIQITNVGLGQHDFVVDELEIAADLPNGEPVEVTVPDDATPGDAFVYYCSVPAHRENGMGGELTIVEAGAAPAAPAGGSAEATPPPTGESATPPPAETSPSSPAAVTAQAPEASVSIQATPRPGTIGLEAQDPYVWNPASLTVNPGDVISITNSGVLEHDFSVDEWSISQYLPNGGLVEVQVPEDVQPGQTFVFYCSTVGHRKNGMEGTITVE